MAPPPDLVDLPPGPRSSRALQTLAWATRPVPFLLRCQEQFGDAFTIRIGTEPPWAVLAHPDMVRDVFTADPEVARAGEANAILEPVLGARSVLLVDGREHLRQRRLLLPPFHGEALASYRATMREVAAAEIASWPRGAPLRTQPRMAALTLEIILRTVFGARDAQSLARLRTVLRRMLEDVATPASFLLVALLGPKRVRSVPRLRKLLEAVDREVFAAIEARRAAPDLDERDDVLSLLLRARAEDGDDLTDQELRDELVTLLVAGHETTATALSWALERLVRDPARLERLRGEAADGHSAYAQAVCREALRLRPVIPVVVRRVHAPLSAGGVELPEGATAVPCIQLVHRRPDVYPDPHRFVPERFLDTAPGTYTWFPFGGGVRRCLGASFALMEMEEVLLEVARSAELRPARDDDGEGVTRRAITLAPARGGEVVAA
ncbi:cytochrome P450 [Conexibacter sp. SYSU D00693]|uniref:cytochrome P450 n=1 Tax=Conexibacter sp. SYSU D00693 TaxID=2812560 RepID=UPI00196A8B54|nr:cytochrome P450 [Conexibacter sp. SYSU D00693]